MTGAVQFDFTGKCVLVTGASRGIGKAIASGFSSAGASVWVLADDEIIADSAAAITTESGNAAIGICCDISDPQAVKDSLAGLPRIDILVNNAGYQPRTPVSSPSAKSDEDFASVMSINVMGTWHVTRNALKKMPDGGRIIVTSSIWGKTGEAGYSGYAASKHANIGFVRTLAMELGARGITVNAVCPGWVDTEGAMWTVREIAREQGRSVDTLVSEYLQGQPLKGMMTPSDIAGTYLFLASNAAKDITGQAINVDRGAFIG